jgi:hypothetical protein
MFVKILVKAGGCCRTRPAAFSRVRAIKQQKYLVRTNTTICIGK